MSERVQFRYEEIADRIAGMIERGTIRPGERIPSVRKLSEGAGVSLSTVLQAYYTLEGRGLIEARPQSGFYARLVPRHVPPEPSAPGAMSAAHQVNVGDLVADVVQAVRNPEIIPLGAACPSPELFPTRKLQRVISGIIRRMGSAVNTYDIVPGNMEIRRQIARRSVDWGCNLAAEDIVVTCGCMEALNLCLRAVTNPGDTVAVESPTYFGILQILETLNLKALEIPTHSGDGIDMKALHSAVRKHRIAACLFMPSFHNPLGSLMPDEKKKEMVALLAEKKIPLIEDDMYGDLHFGPHRPPAAKAYDKQGLVLLCSSFTKVLAPGFRVGWVAPGKFRKQVERLKLVSTMGTGTLPQLVLAEFLKNGSYDRHLQKLRRNYRQQVQLVTEAVSKYFPQGTRVARPEGGFVLWVELPERIDSLKLYRKALEKNISIAPGPMFSAKQDFHNFIRLNCGQLWNDKLDRALFTLGQIAFNL